jgi:N-methylhydantoinase A
MRRIICPPAAGVASALGFLVSPFTIELARTLPGRLGELAWEPVMERFEEMEGQAREMLRKGGADVADAVVERRVEMRYVGQGYEVSVPLPPGRLTADLERELRDAFNQLYRNQFGSSLDGAGVECVHWRLTASVPAPGADVRLSAVAAGHAEKGERRVFFPELGGYTSCPVFDRYRLAPGFHAGGPALIEERESTIVVGPGGSWEMDHLGNVIVHIGPEEETLR